MRKNKIVGILMLLAVFVVLFTLTAISVGIIKTLTVWLIAIGLYAIIVVGVNLLVDK